MPSLFKKLTILAVGAALVGGSAVAIGATTASAAITTGTHAVGLTFRGGSTHPAAVWAGTWNNGGRGFCMDFGATTPNRSGTTVYTGNLPGMTAEESKQAKFVANKYAATGSNEVAANAGFAIWRYAADAKFNTWYAWARANGVVTTARHNAINAIIIDARQHAAYKMTVSVTKVVVGQKGSGAVKVLGSNGYAAVGRKVTLTPTQFTVANAGKILTVNGVARNWGYTGSTGVVSYTYQRVTTGTVGFKATLTAPSSAKAGVSITTAGHQRTLSGGYSESAVAYASYVTYAPVAISQVCDTTCNGMATVTFRSANPAGAQNIKWVEKNGAAVVATFNVKAGTTGTKTARLSDGSRITNSFYCYTGSVLGGPCTTPTVALATPFEVVCPAWAVATIVTPCNCQLNQSVSATFTSPAASPRFYRAYVKVNNGTAIAKDLVNGKALTITTAKLGKNSTVVVSFAVYRDAARTILMGSHILKTVVVY